MGSGADPAPSIRCPNGYRYQWMHAIELDFLAAPTAATKARTEVTQRLANLLGASVLEDVRLLVTELITNALRHGKLTSGDHVSVKASITDDVVRIEVRDPGKDGDVAPREPGARGGGYGLYLVDRLAKRWGVDQRDGTVVWCELSPATGR
jgi:anti-sigma regulatory factor (Ser/Thr protein kinase)